MVHKKKIELPDDGSEAVVIRARSVAKRVRTAVGKCVITRAANDVPPQMALKNVQGKGIFVGTWTPEHCDGTRIGKFDLYVAPEDLKKGGLLGKKQLLMTFNEAVQHVATLQDYHGYSGFNHNVSGKTPDEALYDALRNGTYKGEWFIPPKDVLHDNLYKNKDKGDLSGTFATTSNGAELARRYWSCTGPASIWSYARIPSFRSRVVDWNLKVLNKRSVRCVRAEPRP